MDALYRLLKEKPKLPFVVIYRIALDVGRGLQTLHLNGIFHRDLKSMNVLLKYEYQEGNHNHLTAKISDFGLSKMKSEEIEYKRKLKTLKAPRMWMVRRNCLIILCPKRIMLQIFIPLV